MFVFLAIQEHKHAGKAGLWDAYEGRGLQVAAGLHQKRTGSQRLQEPNDLQCQDQGISDAAAEDEWAAGHDGTWRQVYI